MSPENLTNKSNKPIETDSSEIVKRHLEDENHEISDEDIRNVKVISEDDVPDTTRAEAAASFTEESDDENNNDNDPPDPNNKPVTPWDVISE